MNEILIRRMHIGDMDEVMEVEQASFITPWSRVAFEGEITDNDLACYLVLVDGVRVVGYAGMWIIIDEAHITNVALLPEYRGRGLGEKLMIALMAEARGRGAKSITLEVRASNSPAKRLYAKLGFICCGVRRQYYTDTKEDALIMWREGL